ncbi:MAG TPA: elongation factor G [Acidimicrobiales bacterium]|nr:elongation factor G [Acidimicrobiales bacterium]
MKTYAPAKIRNVALVGHGGAGKTTLTEALLHCAGAISRPGRVEDGSTVTDFEPEEQKRGLSVAVGVAPLEWSDHKINILDCPGYADFAPEALAALRVADMAVFVVSAVEGVEVQTEVMWRAAADLQLPRLIFVNKLDRERASFERTLQQLQDTFGAGIAPLELPIGEEAGFVGVADLLSDTAITYQSGQPTTGPIPDDMAVREHSVHDSLVEGIVVADDELMERYLEGDIPSVEELEKTLAHGVASGQVFPVLCGSASKAVAIDRLATFICEIGPSPLDRPPLTVEAGDSLSEVPPDAGGQPLAWVWKTVVDRHVGKISLFKVVSGSVKGDDVLVNSRTRAEERLHGLFSLRGKEQVPSDGFSVGDIGAVAKLADVLTGDTLAPKTMPVSVTAFDPPEPVLQIGIRPRSKGDEDKLMTALHRLQDEDPVLTVRRDDETHQTLLGGSGETHLAIVTERLARKFGVEVETEAVVVPYRETVTGTAEAEGKHKKQSGGHGQFGVCNIRMKPLERGGGFEFVDEIVGGAIPRQFIPAVQKGIEEAMAAGGVQGWPVVDVSVTLYDGKFHTVDSSEMSFKMAGSLAFREAMEKAQPILLEPISKLEVIVPTAYQGDVMGDLNGRRGRVQGTETGGNGDSVITALVPTSEILRYAIDLRSLTGGRGRFHAEHDHYDPLPQNLWASVSRSSSS